MSRAVVLHVNNPKITNKYPSLVIPGYIYSVKGEPLTDHKVKNCVRPIKLEHGTANHPREKTYQRIESSDSESAASNSSRATE
jgi:hypothetical protein